MIDEELKQIVQENKQILDKIDDRLHKIEKRFIWSSIFSFIKIFIIVAPIVLGIIYLTPFLQDFIKVYDPIVRNFPITLQNLSNNSDNTVVSGDTQELLKSFCDPETREATVNQLCK